MKRGMMGADDFTLEAGERLDLLARISYLLLANGAATYRVEETIIIIGDALGLNGVEVFVTPTGFTLHTAGPAGALTRVRRVPHTGVNMNRISALNGLSRRAAQGQMTDKQIADRLGEIERQRPVYPAWLVVVGVSLACGAFALLLGGGSREFAATIMGALAGMLSRLWLRNARLLPLMVVVGAAFAATTGSWLGCRVLACPAPNIAPVAAVLQFVPGVPLVTAVIDLATGDILSGVARGAYAALMIVGVALGMLLLLAWGVR